MIIPGVQKPHWRPWHSRKASCTGCRVPFWASPSIVVTSAPSAWTASTLHDFTLEPLRWTVHAPQLLVSQPMTVPVLPRRSRRYCTSSMRGSTSSETWAPSTERLIRVMQRTLGARGWLHVGPQHQPGDLGRLRADLGDRGRLPQHALARRADGEQAGYDDAVGADHLAGGC